MKFFTGQIVQVTTTFKEFEGNTFDPATVIFKFRSRLGAVSTPPPHHAAKGVFQAEQELSESGTWWYRAEARNAEGKSLAADEGPIEVQPSHF